MNVYSCIIFCSKFNHPNIVKILAVCVDNDPVFIIMELMPAGDLLKFLREARPESVSLHVHIHEKEIVLGSDKPTHLIVTTHSYIFCRQQNNGNI